MLVSVFRNALVLTDGVLRKLATDVAMTATTAVAATVPVDVARTQGDGMGITTAVRIRTLTFAAALMCAALIYATPGSATTPVVSFGPSDGESLELLTGTQWGSASKDGDFPNGAAYWWDHTNLTIAVRAAPSARPENVQAMHDAIALWSSVLASRLPEISLTDVTATAGNPTDADIVLRLVPNTGGWAWGGWATCENDMCKIQVKEEWPAGQGPYGEGVGVSDARDPLRNQRTAIHEVGHALGLGHVTPLLQSIDIMGYGWAEADPDVTPILSDCDIEGVRTVFGWVYNNETPQPSTVSEVIC